jgi:hypothetical protein
MTGKKQDKAVCKRVRFSSVAGRKWMNREAKRKMRMASETTGGNALRSIESILEPQPKEQLLRQLDLRTRAILK